MKGVERGLKGLKEAAVERRRRTSADEKDRKPAGERERRRPRVLAKGVFTDSLGQTVKFGDFIDRASRGGGRKRDRDRAGRTTEDKTFGDSPTRRG